MGLEYDIALERMAMLRAEAEVANRWARALGDAAPGRTAAGRRRPRRWRWRRFGARLASSSATESPLRV